MVPVVDPRVAPGVLGAGLEMVVCVGVSVGLFQLNGEGADEAAGAGEAKKKVK